MVKAAPPGGIPRYRPTALPALFSQGFRPFFLAAAIWSALSIALWLGVLAGAIELPTYFDPAAWHAHEMLFGYAMPVIAGYLLTIVPNWTGRMPLQGVPLLCLALLWLSGRVAVASSVLIGGPIAAAVDLSFPILLLLALAREVAAGHSWRSLPMIGAIGLLTIANGLMHLHAGGLIGDRAIGPSLAISTIAALIALVGGRIIPSFTRNLLAKRGIKFLPASFAPTDRVTLAFVAVAVAAWTAELAAPVSGTLLVVAGVALCVHLARWRSRATLDDALLWPLHLGYAWLALGLVLLGLGLLWPQWPPLAGLHAITAGAIGSMTLAVMARATLSHTGHAAVALRGTSLLQLMVSMSTILRIAAAFAPEWHFPLLTGAGALWVAAFSMFAMTYGQVVILQAVRTPKKHKNSRFNRGNWKITLSRLSNWNEGKPTRPLHSLQVELCLS